jgi:alkylation response protein AidB-like acyl-CoA dehydrogenase
VESNLPRRGEHPQVDEHAIQAQIFDAGFAGIAFPTAYGGAGLTLDHQRAFYEEAEGYVTPQGFGVSIAMLGATLLDFGSEELKKRHLPRILRGDELWIQLLSEPNGGSDMAGALTRLSRDGETYILTGSKMWSSGAQRADFGMCLARTDFDAPKHRGLSMVAVPLQGTPGVTIDTILQATSVPGDFCTEFFDDVVLPISNLIGDENQGWAVAQRLLFHERNATAGISHGLGLMGGGGEGGADYYMGGGALLRGARVRGMAGDPVLRQRIAESQIEHVVSMAARKRIMAGMQTGAFQGQWGSLLKLHIGENSPRHAKAALSVWGPDGVIWEGDEVVSGCIGEQFLGSRGISIAGGTNEMQRNIVSERLLGLPREPSIDRDLPFSEVLRLRHHDAH